MLHLEAILYRGGATFDQGQILNTVRLAAVALRNLLSESLIHRKKNLSDFIFPFYSCF